MYYFTENGIENDNGVLACINGELSSVKMNLGIDDTSIISLENQLKYITVSNLMFGNIEGECRLLFKNNLLISMTFTPSMKQYVSELKQVTRQELYSCVYKAYKEINEYMQSLNVLCIETGEKKTIYKINQLRISVNIDSLNESVSIVQEAIN